MTNDLIGSRKGPMFKF